ncbi:MAG: MarC family protein, partial [Planctomycetaceae bacterium]|nr:MarC family protein [Planctomycetaceae bacterium]
MSIQEHLQAFVTVISLVNPAICAAMFSRIEAGQSPRTQFLDATKASIAILIILILAALFGIQVLNQFGVSLNAFQVAGGGVLAWMGFGMLKGDSAKAQTSQDNQQKPSLTPLILFAASPGTITGVITIAVNHSRTRLPLTAIVAVCVTMLLTWPVMIAVTRLGGHQGPGF